MDVLTQGIEYHGYDGNFPVQGKQSPIIVSNLKQKGNLLRIINGESIGTIVS